jgi:hypothetical protein
MVADGTLVIAGVAAGTAASSVGGACLDGAQKKDGYQWHHLATDKNDLSPVRGGPWTPRFEDLFTKAGMRLDDPANRVYLRDHQGPHPEAYHEEVHERLLAAVSQCHPQEQCRRRLTEELKRIAGEVCTRGSRLHRLLTKG